GPSALPRFEGRVAIVTGAARGMGRAHALALAREGCDLVICDILEGLPDGTPYPKATRAEFEAVRAAVEQAGRRCIAVQADVADPAASAGLIDAAVETFGRLDYLVANAALTLEGPIVEQTPERFDTVIRANLHGVFNVLAPAMKVMTGRKFGRIVIIGSGASKHAEAAAARYVASKWGV